MPYALEPDGWRSTERRRNDGAVESEQRALGTGPAVELSELGARELGAAYWRELSRTCRGLVRCRERDGGLALLLLGAGPALLAFGPAEVGVEGERVSCRYPIRGGLLARRPVGALALGQSGSELTVTVSGYFPRLARGLFGLQRRAHVAIARRYLERLTTQ